MGSLSSPPLLLKVTVADGSDWPLGVQQHPYPSRKPPASGSLLQCVPRHALLWCLEAVASAPGS